MESKQFNVRMPMFAHEELGDLRRGLRALGSKPSDADLVAALLHAALEDIAATKAQVEAWVVHELAVEVEEAEAKEKSEEV